MMKSYFVKTPWWLKKIFRSRVWSIDTKEKILYLTFDDGPHPLATPLVLDELKKYNAKATFFCIGKNVESNSYLYNRILIEGHTTGNHTYDHLNGWNTGDEEYVHNISKASQYIKSILFRPPYGKIKSSQVRKLKGYKIVMWDVLSGDFDENISSENCLANVINRTRSGSIIVFHDSQKAFQKLRFVLPKILENFSAKGYRFEAIIT